MARSASRKKKPPKQKSFVVIREDPPAEYTPHGSTALVAYCLNEGELELLPEGQGYVILEGTSLSPGKAARTLKARNAVVDVNHKRTIKKRGAR